MAMTVGFLLSKIEYYNNQKGLGKKFLKSASPTIEALKKLLDSKLSNMTPTTPIPKNVTADILAILDSNQHTGNLTLQIIRELRAELAKKEEPVVKIRIKTPKNNPADTYTPETSLTLPTTYIAPEIFFGTPFINPCDYHLGIYTHAHLSEEGMLCTTSHDFKPMPKPTASVLFSNLASGQYYCNVELLKTNEWQPLPGASVYDDLTALRVDAENYELRRCQLTQQIQIKLTHYPLQAKAFLKYNVTVTEKELTPPPPTIESEEICFEALKKNDVTPLKQLSPEDQCCVLFKFFNGFAEQFPDDYLPPESKQQQWLDYLTYGVGASRHRATWFLMFAQQLQLLAELHISIPHAFIVVTLAGRHPLDLGGLDSRILNASKTIEGKTTLTPSFNTPYPKKAFRTEEEVIAEEDRLAELQRVQVERNKAAAESSSILLNKLLYGQKR